jgi:hypothetical protein
VLEYLLEKGAITNFFDIISVVSGNLVSQNAIHYINKAPPILSQRKVWVRAE